MKKQLTLALQIAATYIGTVVGAGFATGQEIVQFFTRHYHWGVLGIIGSMFLFIWLGKKMMLLSHHIGAYSYQELNQYLFGKGLGAVANGFVFFILFGVTSVMLSGTGAIFEEQLGLPFQVGILVTLALSFLVILKGMKGLFIVNSLVVPMMLTFTIIIAFKVGMTAPNGIGSVFNLGSWSGNWQGWSWVSSALTYVAFNLAMAQAVLVPLGKEVTSVRALHLGGLLGGLGLGFMLLTSHFALVTLMPEALHFDIPIAFVIKEFGWLVLLLFLLVIYGEVFTTLIGNVFGLNRQIISLVKLPEKWVIAMILLTSFVISQIGFSSLVSYLYPIFGYMGLALLLMLAVRKIPQIKQ
ncbi:hypothetical protein [Bacillus horti]|uniref:Membrane protein YkvI n=1 Tax=Caldalkalibacillus horti TaxID=77523 RepID=A0ABT9W3B4_9BACI|nr:hypothetical protein [Bacillus horti]MDQ0167740.1 putative membrane protein YkvI [Bacillus horti]